MDFIPSVVIDISFFTLTELASAEGLNLNHPHIYFIKEAYDIRSLHMTLLHSFDTLMNPRHLPVRLHDFCTSPSLNPQLSIDLRDFKTKPSSSYSLSPAPYEFRSVNSWCLASDKSCAQLYYSYRHAI